MLDEHDQGRVLALADKIRDHWTLCNLCEGLGRAAEMETMIAQTMHVCRKNMKADKGCFSVRGDGVFSSGGCVDNAGAYNNLIIKEFIVEEEVGDVARIYPTLKLIAFLEEFFIARPERELEVNS